MTLGEAQELLGQYLPLLLIYMRTCGFRPRPYYLERCEDCKRKLAINIGLFLPDGTYLDKTEDHAIFGKFWESLHPQLRWEGRFGDGNHYAVFV